MNERKPTLSAFIVCLATLLPLAARAGVPPGFNAGVERFIDRISSQHAFDKTRLQQLINQRRYRQRIIDTITRPAEAKPWHRYRPIFVTDSRITQGVRFWKENEAILSKAEAHYGVPAEIIVAIIGVETRYGRHTGGFPVLDALTTLGFGYPKRGKFFRRQLEEFLLLCREEGISPTDARGSYAGAMGKPQFMPSSYRSYAVDFDQDGRRDLWNSNADAIGSVAAYLKAHGWRPGEPITSPARGVNKAHSRFVKAGIKPSITLGELRAAGITPGDELPNGRLSSLIKLELRQGHEYWLGLHNFYVITRYNHSNLYAMAVYQLSQGILKRRKAGVSHDAS